MANFQYFLRLPLKNGVIIEAKQLYFDYHLWYLIRLNYSGCTKYRKYISTNGNELKNKNLPLPTHSAHTLTSKDEFKIMQHLEVIKDRVAKEVHTWPSIIYDEEIVKLQTLQKLSADYLLRCFRANNTQKSLSELLDIYFLLEEHV